MPSCEVRAHGSSAAPPSAVFALLTDIESWSAWGDWERTELEAADARGGGGPGAIRRLTSRTFGQVVVAREEVLEVEPERRIVYRLLSGLPLRGYVGRVELAPDGAGGTRITWSASFDPERWGTGWLYRAALQRFVARTVASLARAAEQTASRAA